jgi:hypothetical protein
LTGCYITKRRRCAAQEPWAIPAGAGDRPTTHSHANGLRISSVKITAGMLPQHALAATRTDLQRPQGEYDNLASLELPERRFHTASTSSGRSEFSSKTPDSARRAIPRLRVTAATTAALSDGHASPGAAAAPETLNRRPHGRGDQNCTVLQSLPCFASFIFRRRSTG